MFQCVLHVKVVPLHAPLHAPLHVPLHVPLHAPLHVHMSVWSAGAHVSMGVFD